MTDTTFTRIKSETIDYAKRLHCYQWEINSLYEAADDGEFVAALKKFNCAAALDIREFGIAQIAAVKQFDRYINGGV